MTTTVPDPGEGWIINPGFQPETTRGKRVSIVLANGNKAKTVWSANDSQWSLRGFEFDIAWYRVET